MSAAELRDLLVEARACWARACAAGDAKARFQALELMVRINILRHRLAAHGAGP